MLKPPSRSVDGDLEQTKRSVVQLALHEGGDGFWGAILQT